MEFAEQNENKGRALEKKGAGATAQIREVVQKVESKSKTYNSRQTGSQGSKSPQKKG